jgi:Rod binding domain-containing protein
MTTQMLSNITGPDNHPVSLQSATNGGKLSTGDKKKAEIRKVAGEFQSLFVELMLKSMRETVSQDKLTGGGHGEEVYGSMLDHEYAAAISRRGNLGLAEMIERQMLAQESGSKKALEGSTGIPNDRKTTKNNKIEGSHEN